MARVALRAAALYFGQLYPCAALPCSTAASTSSRNWSPTAPRMTPHPYSLSCNPDLTLDLLALRRERRVDFLFAGQTNSELPFMPGDAAIAAAEFDFLLDSPATDFPLFAPPREPVSLTDYAAGLHAASIVPDGGTLQIGIGSLGDAVAQALILRHAQERRLLQAAHAAWATTMRATPPFTPSRSKSASTAARKCSSRGCSIFTAPGYSSAR